MSETIMDETELVKTEINRETKQSAPSSTIETTAGNTNNSSESNRVNSSAINIDGKQALEPHTRDKAAPMINVKPESTGRQLKRLWSFMEGNRLLYFGALLGVGFATLFAYAGPLVIKVTIDSIIGTEPVQLPLPFMQTLAAQWLDAAGGRNYVALNLWICGSLLIMLTLCRGVFSFLHGKWAARAGENIALKIRDTLYNHLQYLPFSYHVTAETGDIIQRCTTDVENIRRFLALQLVEMGRALFMLGLAVPILVSLSPQLSLTAMLIIPLVIIFSLVFFKKVRAAFEDMEEAEGAMTTVLQENLTGIRVVRAFGRPAFEMDKFDRISIEFREKTRKLIRLFAFYWSITDFMILSQTAAILVVGSYLAVTGNISIGVLVVFITYMGMLMWPIRQMGRVITDLSKTVVALKRIGAILDEPLEEASPKGLKPPIKGAVEFQNVSFGYDNCKQNGKNGDRAAKNEKSAENSNNDSNRSRSKGDRAANAANAANESTRSLKSGAGEAETIRVLNNISFKIEPGQTVAILGPTGSGKSTLVQLLPRLYDPEGGRILIDGIDIKDLDRSYLRRHIGFVLQEPFLYTKTVAENIALAKSQASHSEVVQAARWAHIAHVIEEFDKKWDTLVGERGVTLSGGQKQRVAIARALIRNTPILVFDDSLSAVDTETDAAIQSALLNREKKATTFIISHRVTTLSRADLVLVLEEGRITQTGTHRQLISQPGLYRNIWLAQKYKNQKYQGKQTEAANKQAQS